MNCDISTGLVAFLNVFMMGKLSNEDKMHIQIRCEQRYGAKVTKSKLSWQKLELEHISDDLLSAGWEFQL